MVFVPAIHTVEIVQTIRNRNNQQLAKNVYHARKRVGGVGASDVERMATVIMPSWETAQGKSSRSTEVETIGFTVRDLGSVDSFVYDNTLAPPIQGAVANPVLPMHTTIAIKFTTGLAGRSFRGRTYWIGLYESSVAGDFVTAAVVTALIAKLNNLKEALDAEGWDFVVVSKFHNGAPREAAAITNISGIGVTDNRVDTQRRRLIGEGQ